MTDWGELYRANIAAVTALGGSLPEAELDTRVPATPAWTVRQVIAHLAGGPTDVLNDRMDGAPGPEWTGRQVAERSDRSVEELLTELRGSVDAVVASVEGNDRPGLVWNAAVHHADLHEALGKGTPPREMWQPVVDALTPSLGEHEAALDGVPDYERFRMFFSRRSRSQTAGWDTGLDQETLDGFSIFGPRDDDQPVPG